MATEEIIEVFGKRIYEGQELAPELCSDLAIRLEDVLKKGIPADILKEIIKKYPPPKNCTFFEPPKLNAVIKSVMLDTIVKRDERIMTRQEKISAALAAAVQIILMLAENKSITGWKSLMEMICDVSKLVADLQHDESLIRRNLLIANVSSTMKDTLTSTIIDEFLFGKDLDETLKNAKALQTTGKELRKPVKVTQAKIPSKNVKPPPRWNRPREGTTTAGGRKPRNQSSQKRPRQTYRKPHERRESRSSRTHRT